MNTSRARQLAGALVQLPLLVLSGCLFSSTPISSTPGGGDMGVDMGRDMGVVDMPVDMSMCAQTCTPGQTRCAEGTEGIQTCMLGEGGCTAWSEAAPCTGAGEVCDDSGQAPICVMGQSCPEDVCVRDTRMCGDDPSAYVICTVDGRGCLTWVTRACADDEMCSGEGQCAVPCEDACSSDEKKCSADRNAVETCEQDEQTGCMVWKSTPCVGEICLEGDNLVVCAPDNGACLLDGCPKSREGAMRCAALPGVYEVCAFDQTRDCYTWTSRLCRDVADKPALVGCSPDRQSAIGCVTATKCDREPCQMSCDHDMNTGGVVCQ